MTQTMRRYKNNEKIQNRVQGASYQRLSSSWLCQEQQRFFILFIFLREKTQE